MTNTRFAKLVLLINGLVPAGFLLWDYQQHQLGPNPVNGSLHITGMTALVFLGLTLLITPLRKITRYNELILYRRTLGLFAFYYALTHFFIFFAFDREFSIASTLSEMVKRKYLVVGSIGLLAMIPLAITSTNTAVRRLGIQRWQALHKLVYVAALAGAIHYYMLVKADVRLPLVFIFVIGGLLLYRWLAMFGSTREVRQLKPITIPRAPETPAIPARPTALARPGLPAAHQQAHFWTGDLRVLQVFDETDQIRTFRLGAADGSAVLPFEYQPGQYLTVSLMINGKKVNRPFTIASSSARPAYCEITTKRERTGIATKFMHDHLHAGDLLTISAPMGRFIFSGGEAESIVLIGGGVGLTPLMAIIRYLTDRSWPGEIFLVYSAKTERDIVFRDELKLLAARFPNLHVTITLTQAEDSDWQGHHGRITPQLLQQSVPAISARLIHLCGPSEMMGTLKQTLAQLGVPANHVKIEIFDSLRISRLPKLRKPDGPNLQPAPPRRPLAALPPVKEKEIVPEIAEEIAEPVCTFALSGKTAFVQPGQTLLEAAEEIGVKIDFDCRSGICGTCRTKLLAGSVTMEVTEALTAADEVANFILCCQAKPVGDVTLQA